MQSEPQTPRACAQVCVCVCVCVVNMSSSAPQKNKTGKSLQSINTKPTSKPRRLPLKNEEALAQPHVRPSVEARASQPRPMCEWPFCGQSPVTARHPELKPAECRRAATLQWCRRKDPRERMHKQGLDIWKCWIVLMHCFALRSACLDRWRVFFAASWFARRPWAGQTAIQIGVLGLGS